MIPWYIVVTTAIMRVLPNISETDQRAARLPFASARKGSSVRSYLTVAEGLDYVCSLNYSPSCRSGQVDGTKLSVVWYGDEPHQPSNLNFPKRTWVEHKFLTDLSNLCGSVGENDCTTPLPWTPLFVTLAS